MTFIRVYILTKKIANKQRVSLRCNKLTLCLFFYLKPHKGFKMRIFAHAIGKEFICMLDIFNEYAHKISKIHPKVINVKLKIGLRSEIIFV